MEHSGSFVEWTSSSILSASIRKGMKSRMLTSKSWAETVLMVRLPKGNSCGHRHSSASGSFYIVRNYDESSTTDGVEQRLLGYRK